MGRCAPALVRCCCVAAHPLLCCVLRVPLSECCRNAAAAAPFTRTMAGRHDSPAALCAPPPPRARPRRVAGRPGCHGGSAGRPAEAAGANGAAGMCGPHQARGVFAPPPVPPDLLRHAWPTKKASGCHGSTRHPPLRRWGRASAAERPRSEPPRRHRHDPPPPLGGLFRRLTRRSSWRPASPACRPRPRLPASCSGRWRVCRSRRARWRRWHRRPPMRGHG